MKTLTKEAKIHSATVVDDYKLTGSDTDFYKDKFDGYIDIGEYNPNDPDSPYCMKYLRGIIKGFERRTQNYDLHYWSLDALIKPESIIRYVLRNTGFKGEVWDV